MNDIKVSIVMPVLNGMPYFKKALNSIVNQTLHEIEILVVDSGSSDGTREYVLDLIETDNRVKLLDAKKRSMGYQYNLGISNAKGQYIGFCECDDYIEDNAYKRLYEEAMQQKCPEVVKSDFYMFYNKKEKEHSFYYSIFQKKDELLYEKIINLEKVFLLFKRDFNMWNGIYKNSFLKENKILLNETDGAAFQDIGFGLQISMKAKKMVYIQEAFYHYRKDNNHSSIYKKKTYRFVIWELIYMLEWLKKNRHQKMFFEPSVIDRLFVFFAEAYGKYVYENDLYEDIQDEEIENLRTRLLNWYQQQDYPILAELEYIELLNLFLESNEEFTKAVRKKAKNQMEELSNFWNYITKERDIIIFGCGEYGQNLLALILKNKYYGNISFCDNNRDKQFTKILGYDIWPVEYAYTHFSDACFLIPSKWLYNEMKFQLLKMGVKREKIISAPEIALHAATEICIMKNQR